MLSLFFTLMSVTHVAEAKRFGMGKSFGYNKQVAPKQYTPSKTTAAKPAAATRPASGASKWLGPLAGGLIAAMLFGDGFDGLQFFDILMFALIAFVLFKLFARKAQSRTEEQYQPVYAEQDKTRQDAFSNEQNAFRKANGQANGQTNETSVMNGSSSNSGSIIGADLDDGMGQGVSNNAQFLNEIPAWFDEARFC